MKTKIKKQKNNKKSGFTLVELLITISIFVVITGVVLVNSNDFDNTILLHNFTYDVALTIEQAQTYGVNAKENSLGNFNTAYGVYFNTAESTTNFILFNDLPDSNGNVDYKYTNYYGNDNLSCSTSDTECIQKYSMTRGTFIKSMCAAGKDNNCDPVSELSILFQRPNLDALIYTFDSGRATSTYARIVLSAVNGATSTVVVTSAGQIYTQN